MEKKLFHGSPETKLTELIPGKPKKKGEANLNHPHHVFATSAPEVAALFTLHPDTVNFTVDYEGKRVFIPNEHDFRQKDQGGAIYQVAGNFHPASDTRIREYSTWQKPDIVERIEIPSAEAFLNNQGFEIYAGEDLQAEVEEYYQTHRKYPTTVPGKHKPINK